MSVLRFGGFWQPAWTRTAIMFAGTTSAVADRLQPAVNRAAVISNEAARLVAAFLTPAAVTAASMALWRLGADMGWTGAFAISDGFFSHWQVWMILALGMMLTGKLISTVPKGDGQSNPDELNFKD